jgi:S-layer protein (TIGR01564 family)
VQLANSDAWFKYDKDKQIDVIRKKKATIASGSSIDSDKSPWSEFLEQDIIASAVGGTQQAVSLSIVKDTDVTSSDKTNFNLVLMGGPVANVLTSDLVTQGKSTVDWFTSSGDIEVIPNAFVTGRTAIVVAGENRAATATAASNLAAQV